MMQENVWSTQYIKEKKVHSSKLNRYKVGKHNMKKISKIEAKKLRKLGKKVKTTHNGYYLMNV